MHLHNTAKTRSRYGRRHELRARASGVGVLVLWEPGEVTSGGESSHEWDGLPTRVRNW